MERRYPTARIAAQTIYNRLDSRTHAVFPAQRHEQFMLINDEAYGQVEIFIKDHFDVNLLDVFSRNGSSWVREARKGSFEDFVIAILLHAGYITLPTIRAKAIVMENTNAPSIHDSAEFPNDVPDEVVGEFLGDLLRAAHNDGMRIRNGMTIVLTLTENEIEWYAEPKRS